MQADQVYFAGGCLWGVQEFFRYVPGVVATEAGRANGTGHTTGADYDGYAECVRINFCTREQSVFGLMPYLFEIIDPYSIDQQGIDVGRKYRTGVYSEHPQHLAEASEYIASRMDSDRVVVEVLPLTNYVPSDAEHQDRLFRCPQDYCHIEPSVLHKYRRKKCGEVAHQL